MDLLRMIQQNRQAQAQVQKAPVEERAKMKKVRGTPSPLAKPTEDVPGSKAFRMKIIEDKPTKKKVKEHFESIIALECESSDDED